MYMNMIAPIIKIINKHKGFAILLLSTVDIWARIIKPFAKALTVLLDFSKVFHTVPHQQLLLKLQHYDTHGSLLKWFNLFISQRRQ